jgi:BirA family transcriptional regulator, biotin operon repressor / biotin---[acetyl-CoA-carboxylase] ligase
MRKGEAKELGITSAVVGHHVIDLEEVTSTNDLALQMAEEGAPEGLAVIAERQTRGRGRNGRRWESPSGGLWTSIILRPSNPASHGVIFTLVGAVASVEAIRLISDIRVLVGAPNDLLREGKKIGGVLCEERVAGREIRYLVMGIGINVNQTKEDFSPSLRALATSIRMESERIWDPRILAEALYGRLDFWYHRIRENDFLPLFVRLGEVSEGDGSQWSPVRRVLGVS